MPKFAIPVGGLTKLAQSIAGTGADGTDVYTGAYNKALLGQSQIAQAIANARLRNTQADDLERSAAMQTPDAVQRNAQTLVGIPLDAAPDISEYLNTGKISKFAPLPDGAQGPVLPSPDWMGKLGAIGRAIASTQGALTLGDSNSANVAKAYGTYDNIDKQDQVLNGGLAASKLGQAVAAAAGKPLVTGHEYGSVDNFTGAVDDSNGPAQRFGMLRGAETGKNNAQAGQAKAAAANSYASAGTHNAQTQKIRQDIELGGKGVIVQTENGPILVNPRDATSKPILDPDGKQVAGKAQNPTEAQGKANLFAARAAEADKILNALDGKYSPGAINSKNSLGETYGIGGLLGAAGNSILGESNQKADQAQRDFVNAVLRLESGAAIGKDEFDNAKKQYFPQPGDTRGVIEQKRANRATAIQGLSAMGSPKRNSGPKNITVDY